jgi:hypothetical protein
MQGSVPDQENLHPTLQETEAMSMVMTEEGLMAMRKAALKEQKNLQREVDEAKAFWTKALALQDSNLSEQEKSRLMELADRRLATKLRKHEAYCSAWAWIF